MADQGLWFKLWLGFHEDPHLGNLSDKDLLSWILLGCYLKKHGNNGIIQMEKPARALQNAMRLDSYESLIQVLQKLPNICAREEQKNATLGIVTLFIEWQNWHKYQGDYSTIRSIRWRDRQRFKRRREEKRGEEKEKRVFTRPTFDDVQTYAGEVGFTLDAQKFLDYYEARGWQFKNGQPVKDWKACVRTWKSNGVQEKDTVPAWMK